LTEAAIEQGGKSNPISEWALNDRYGVVRRLLPENFSSLLDIGCGEGHFIKSIIGQYSNAKFVGIDLHGQNIKTARRNSSVDFVVGDAKKLPFKNASFDIAVMLELIEHLESPDEAIAEMLRVLKPSGKLILSTPDGSSLRWKAVWWLWSNTVGRRWHHAHVAEYDQKSLTKLLEESGFQVERVERAIFGCVITVRAKKLR